MLLLLKEQEIAMWFYQIFNSSYYSEMLNKVSQQTAETKERYFIAILAYGQEC